MAATIYVDGESHFRRFEAFLQQSHGEAVKLQDARCPESHGSLSYPDQPGPVLLAQPDCSFFWDRQLPSFLDNKLVREIRNIRRAVYFSSCRGSEDTVHLARVTLRSHGFEPQLLLERRDQANRRQSLREQSSLIEKPKQVDAALVARLLEDAFRGAVQEAFLFTSDVDFVPAIESAQRVGCRVYVCGFRTGLGARSDLEYVPDKFVSLEERASQYVLRRVEGS